MCGARPAFVCQGRLVAAHGGWGGREDGHAPEIPSQPSSDGNSSPRFFIRAAWAILESRTRPGIAHFVIGRCLPPTGERHVGASRWERFRGPDSRFRRPAGRCRALPSQLAHEHATPDSPPHNTPDTTIATHRAAAAFARNSSTDNHRSQCEQRFSVPGSRCRARRAFLRDPRPSETSLAASWCGVSGWTWFTMLTPPPGGGIERRRLGRHSCA